MSSSVAVLVLLGVLATATPPPQTSVTMEVGEESRPGVPPVARDPLPAPGSVLPAGTHLVGARLPGVPRGDLRVFVDGVRAIGPPVEPDGPLSERRGIEVTLPAGRHDLAVGTDAHGVLRRWEVVVSGLAVDRADQDPVALARRTSGRRTTSRPVVLVNPEDARVAAVGVALAARLDALLLPVGAAAIPPTAAEALAATDVAAGEVLLVGGPDLLGAPAVLAVEAAGLQAVRIGGEATAGDAGAAAQVADAAAAWLADLPLDRRPAGRDAVVVTADRPLGAVLDGVTAAASLGASLELVPPTGPLPGTLARLAGLRTVLLGTALSPLARTRLIDGLGDGAVVSDDDLAPRRAAEALVVADGTPTPLALMAARAAEPNRAVVWGTAAARDWVSAMRPDRVTLVGLEDAVDDLADALPSRWVDGADAPDVEVLVDASAGLTVTFTADGPLDAADVHVDLLGFEWPGTMDLRGAVATWTAAPRPRLPEALEPAAPGTGARIDVTAVLRRGAVQRHVGATATARIDPLVSRSREGFLVAGGSSPVVGSGPLRTFSVEVEPSTGLDVVEVAAEAQRILLDPRGWTADGTRSLQRVGTSRAADLRVVVATPATVDRLCGAVGLRTGGRVSCWDGFRAMLNLDRWNTGVAPFHTDLVVYREYLVNHEVGHGLGYGHVFCPAPGAVAPVMMQQTGGLGSCTANGWPYPDAGTTVAVPAG